MEGIDIKVVDRESILYLVQELEDFEKDKAIRSGLLAGANVFKSAGKKRLKERMKNPKGVKGNLLRSFTVRVKKRKLGALSGFKYGEDGGSHSWWVDMGTAERTQKKTGRNTGSARPLLYWTDTREADYPKSIEKIHEGVERFVQRINNMKR